MTRRAGMSLTEVLVALFILTLGVIGILTMFPLGAAQMARAVRDDRSALTAANADAYMRWYWSTYVVNPTIALKGTSSGSQTQTSIQTLQTWVPTGQYDQYLINMTGLFDNPFVAYQNDNRATAMVPLKNYALYNTANPQQSAMNVGNTSFGSFVGQNSFPVIIDPMGFQVRPWNFGDGTNPANCALIPRYGLQFSPLSSPGTNQVLQSQGNVVAQPQLTLYNYRSASLVDSLGFNDNGTPTSDLEMRYNWMCVLQRPEMNYDPTQLSQNIAAQVGTSGQINPYNPASGNLYDAQNQLSFMNMTIVVFDRRPFLYPPNNVPGFEVVMQNTSFTTGLTTVTINAAYSAQALDLKPGSWVMDATINPTATPFPIRQANFYRVVSVVPNASTGQVNLELQTPVAPPMGYNPVGFNYQGTLVALSGVSGVYVRTQLSPYP